MLTETLTPARTEAPPAAAPPAEAPGASVRDLDGPMTWADVCADPFLDDLPYKIEQDRYGRIVMSPPFARHAKRQYRIARLLEDALGGMPATECPVMTADGVKVPDVVWMSEAFEATHGTEEVYLVAPPICVEIRSKSNVWAEMAEKVTLYLARGAQEVWVCEGEGTMHYFGHEGERDKSKLAPDFPAQITL